MVPVGIVCTYKPKKGHHMNIFDTTGDSPEMANAVRRQVKQVTVVKYGEVFISTGFLCMLMDKSIKSGHVAPIVPFGNGVLDLAAARREIDKSNDVVPLDTVRVLLRSAVLQGMRAGEDGNGSVEEADKIAKKVLPVI